MGSAIAISPDKSSKMTIKPIIEHATILDGTTIPFDKVFITGNGNLMMFPADPDGASDEVVGCKCTFGIYPK